jgi:hypothetical protein
MPREEALLLGLLILGILSLAALVTYVVLSGVP